MKADLFRLFGVFAGQSALIEQFVFAASDQSGMAVRAEEEAVGISRVGVTRERPESCGDGVRVNAGRAFEADDSFWVAFVEQEIGPVAAVDFFVVNKSLGAGQEVWHSELALDVAGRAFGAFFVDSELILASRSRDCSR